MYKIDRIIVPSPSIRQIPSPQIRQIPPPIVNGIAPPSVNVPNVRIDYPTIDVPTEQEFQQQMGGQQETTEETEEDTRDMPTSQIQQPVIETQPTIDVGGLEIPVPETAPLVTAGATAVVTTSVALSATIVLNKVKDAAIEPLLRRMATKKKIKIKQTKPVLHYVLDDDGGIDIYQYSAKGTKLVHSTQDVERYLRDQIELDSLYEHDNKIIIDDVIKNQFTKEGAKRFNSLFAPAKTIAKKLSAKFSI